jgi:hypothetical protein
MAQKTNAIALTNFEAHPIQGFDHKPARLASIDLTANI